ncbi:MAG: nucleotidyltransferase family protein [Methylotenera sp.]
MIGILLAAGFSRRFGSQNKLLQPLPDQEILAVHAAKNLLAALPVSIAVVRQDNPALAAKLSHVGMVVIHCPADKTEMADSLVTAIEAAPAIETAAGTATSGGYVIALADMPFIQPATISRVAEAIHHGAQIAMPSYQGQRGHPVGFAAKFHTALTQLSGDEGARAIIKRHAEALTVLETDDAGVVTDIDTQEDFRRHSQRG